MVTTRVSSLASMTFLFAPFLRSSISGRDKTERALHRRTPCGSTTPSHYSSKSSTVQPWPKKQPIHKVLLNDYYSHQLLSRAIMILVPRYLYKSRAASSKVIVEATPDIFIRKHMSHWNDSHDDKEGNDWLGQVLGAPSDQWMVPAQVLY